MLPFSKRQNKPKYNKTAPVVCSMLRRILQEVIDVCHIRLEIIWQWPKSIKHKCHTLKSKKIYKNIFSLGSTEKYEYSAWADQTIFLEKCRWN